jgi:hypothetical protein
MGQTSRIVTVVDGIDVMEVTVRDIDGEQVETRYYVRGEKYMNLKEARTAAGKIAEEQRKLEYRAQGEKYVERFECRDE